MKIAEAPNMEISYMAVESLNPTAGRCWKGRVHKPALLLVKDLQI